MRVAAGYAAWAAPRSEDAVFTDDSARVDRALIRTEREDYSSEYQVCVNRFH